MDKLQKTVDQLGLNVALLPLAIPTIDQYWSTFENFLSTKQKGGSVDPQSVGLLAKNIINNLSSTVGNFTSAFKGGSGIVPLMTAYSDASRHDLLGSANGRFINSGYSKEMAQVFDYYIDEQAKAAILLVNAYNQQDAPAYADDVMQSFPSPYAGRGTAAQGRWEAQVDTLPAYTIPKGVIIDTQSNLMWTQNAYFLTKEGGEAMASYLNTDSIETFTNFYYTTRGLPDETHTWESFLKLKDQIGTSNGGSSISAGVLNWSLPTTDQAEALGTASELEAVGFSVKAGYEGMVWTSNVKQGIYRSRWDGTLPRVDDLKQASVGAGFQLR